MTLAQSNARSLGMAALMYSTDNHGYFPSAKEVEKQIAPNVDDIRGMTHAPEDGSVRLLTYNKALSHIRTDRIHEPSEVPLYFECRPETGQAGTRADMPDKPRYRRGYIVVFADGHVETASAERLDQAKWDPLKASGARPDRPSLRERLGSP